MVFVPESDAVRGKRRSARKPPGDCAPKAERTVGETCPARPWTPAGCAPVGVAARKAVTVRLPIMHDGVDPDTLFSLGVRTGDDEHRKKDRVALIPAQCSASQGDVRARMDTRFM